MSATSNPHVDQRPLHNQPQPDTDPLQSPLKGAEDKLPTHDTVIIHSDGSYQQEHDLSGIGFTLESNTGDTIHEQWEYTPDATTSMETEAAAALLAVRTAKAYSPSFIILYSDCQPLINRIDRACSDRELDGLYAEIYRELESIEITSVNHIPRERNRRADELAHRALDRLRQRQHDSQESQPQQRKLKPSTPRSTRKTRIS